MQQLDWKEPVFTDVAKEHFKAWANVNVIYRRWLAVEETLRKRYHEAYRTYGSQRSRPSLARTYSLSNEPSTTIVKVWDKLTDELLRRLNSIADVADLERFSFRTGDTAAGSTMRPNLTEEAIEESLEFTFARPVNSLKDAYYIKTKFVEIAPPWICDHLIPQFERRIDTMANYTWSFDPLVPTFLATVCPNIALWNVSNGIGLKYKIHLSWPLDWASRDVNNVTALYIRQCPWHERRRAGAPGLHRPDYIVVSIGYPIMTLGEDLPAVVGVCEGLDDFIYFLEHSQKPFVSLSSSTWLSVEALPDLFDTFMSASPTLYWDDGYILNHTYGLNESPSANHTSKPAFRLAYGDLEQYPARRRTETDEQWEFREELYATFSMGDNCNALCETLKGNEALRDVVLKEYVGSHHAAVAAVALADEIDNFVDW
ncbi:putative Alpha/Beta hydrolase protein [Seiridium unicorne]|uniref:Alpha/Beta hydrolase protein n=1 Tax=Seiridium unicorne TaxID=138068 RepID=A0ABR2UWQ2_9PEZI